MNWADPLEHSAVLEQRAWEADVAQRAVGGQTACEGTFVDVDPAEGDAVPVENSRVSAAPGVAARPSM
jgi:hypothetical protein